MMSTHELDTASANASDQSGPSYSPEQDGESADPGVKFLKEISLSPAEEEQYVAQGREWIPALVAFEGGSKDDGWKTVSNMFGVNVCSKAKPVEDKSSLVVCRGQMPMSSDVTMPLLQAQFIKSYNNTESLTQQMRASDPMSRETKIMYQMPCGEDEYFRIVWGSFKAAGVAWARDFSMMQHCCTTTDPSTGERLFCIVAQSIERPEIPDMEKLCKRIRSKASTTGYVFREASDGSVRVSYVVNVNPGGWIPSKLVNAICVSQAMNVSRVANSLSDAAKACAALEMEPPIKSHDIGWRATFEIPIPRPATGAAPAKVSVKFWPTNKVSFRIRGASERATAEWKPSDATFGDGNWVACSGRTPVVVEFTLKPETVGAATKSDDAAPQTRSSTVDVALDGAEACVLEWKAGAWFKGLRVWHMVDVV